MQLGHGLLGPQRLQGRSGLHAVSFSDQPLRLGDPAFQFGPQAILQFVLLPDRLERGGGHPPAPVGLLLAGLDPSNRLGGFTVDGEGGPQPGFGVAQGPLGLLAFGLRARQDAPKLHRILGRQRPVDARTLRSIPPPNQRTASI